MQELIDKIERRTVRCGVIGLGYVGLPLALEFARAGFRVIGIDLDERKVQAIEEGRSYIVDVSDEEIAGPVREGKFSATTDFSVIRELDTINICVPDAAAEDEGSGPHLRRVGRERDPASISVRASW